MRTLVEEILPQPGFGNYLACNREVRKRLQHWTRHDENVFKLIFEELSGVRSIRLKKVFNFFFQSRLFFVF